MGSDKALMPLDGRRLIDFPLEALERVAGETALAVGREQRYPELGLPRVFDDPAFTDGGPLAGLLAGLESSVPEWVCVLACDMPRADGALLNDLLARARADDLDACLLRTEHGLEPLFAVYRTTCAPAIRAALTAGERRMVSFHAGVVDGRPLSIGELSVEAGRAAAAANLNTAEDLDGERARRDEAEPGT